MRSFASPVLSAAAAVAIAAAASGEPLAETAARPPEPAIGFHESPEGVAGVKARLYVAAEPGRVWGVVTDPSKASKLFKNVAAIRPSTKEAGLWDYHVTSVLGEQVVTCKISRDDGRHRLHWKRVGGCLADMYGYYELSEEPAYPGYTRVDYGSYIDPGGIGRVLMTNGKRRTAVLYMISQLRGMTE
ncbi:MAG: SRPBCC family protein [Acidobacteriota bacterium]